MLPDTEVALVVSTGPAPRTVPALAGLTVADATAQLEAMQLVAAVGEPVFSDDIADRQRGVRRRPTSAPRSRAARR